MEKVMIEVKRYAIDTSTPAGKAAYATVCKEAGDVAGHKRKRMWGGACASIVGPGGGPEGLLELEPAFLFADQVNAGGFRVFDWFEDAHPNLAPTYRRGHYIAPGPGWEALKALRAAHYVCGYCGNRHQGHDAPLTCGKCLGSKYLKPDTLHLLTMQPLTGPRRAESATPSLEAYEAAQTAARAAYRVAQTARRRELAERVAVEAEKKIDEVRKEAALKRAVLRADLDVDNFIYYPHTGECVFGWLKGCTQEESEAIRSAGLEFDFKIKMADGTAR